MSGQQEVAELEEYARQYEVRGSSRASRVTPSAGHHPTSHGHPSSNGLHGHPSSNGHSGRESVVTITSSCRDSVIIDQSEHSITRHMTVLTNQNTALHIMLCIGADHATVAGCGAVPPPGVHPPQHCRGQPTLSSLLSSMTTVARMTPVPEQSVRGLTSH